MTTNDPSMQLCTVEEAKAYVKEQNMWQYKYTPNSPTGSKLSYLCKFDNKCSSQIQLWMPNYKLDVFVRKTKSGSAYDVQKDSSKWQYFERLQFLSPNYQQRNQFKVPPINTNVENQFEVPLISTNAENRMDYLGGKSVQDCFIDIMNGVDDNDSMVFEA
ncbi:hypothetical protein BLOT_009830 [Blomia tropicalis]|nr:hypothetical protein BLOT_009830 [Blomia tropicalis]